MAILFTLTVFVSAALLFIVQPLTAKLILPAFGGSPSVWNASILFFQVALLAGYGYAHLSTQKLGLRRHPWLHLPLMAAALISLPMVLPAGYNPAESSLPPVLSLLLLLGLVVGLPFFVVSTGAPILQRWFGATNHKQAHDPYFLYAASNLGSLLGLLAYPFWIEPNLRLADQARLWSYGYGALIVLVALCAIAMQRSPAPSPTTAEADTPAESKPEDDAIPWKRRLTWVVLAAVPSSLMLGVTNFLTTNISPVPLLWVVPLSLYLLTFVGAFSRWRPIQTELLGRFTALTIVPLAMTLALQSSKPILPLSAMHLLVFGLVGLYCHSRLADDRPPVSRLTEFYFWVSVGGMMGGLFNALFAPWAFNTLIEYPIAFVAFLLLRPNREGQPKWKPFDAIYPAIVGIGTLLLIVFADPIQASIGPSVKWVMNMFGAQLAGNPNTRVAITIGIPCLLAFLAIDRSKRFAWSLAAFFLVAELMHTGIPGDLRLSERSFFGVYRVIEFPESGRRDLLHGNTLHGEQMLDPDERRTPLTYYGKVGPIGDVIQEMDKAGKLHTVGLVGLGVGTLSAYGHAGIDMTFFEIDPVVVEIATDPKQFTYISDARQAGANIDIVLGDARLSLLNQQDGKFDLLVLDAFSSDAIPLHLLTVEAFETYLKKMKPGGVIAVHVSNRYLDLTIPLAKTARDLKLSALQWFQATQEIPEGNPGVTQSNWVLLSSDPAAIKPFDRLGVGWYELSTEVEGHAWTDDFSDLLSAFQPRIGE